MNDNMADREILNGGKLLIIGLACVDIVNVARAYPEEDTDQRLLDQQISRGGNATNTSVILSQLGSHVEWLGTLATDKLAGVITEDLDSYGVPYGNAKLYENRVTPLSCVIVNASSGSRTILHQNKDLPEFDSEDFERLDLSKYSWIHFEGRRHSHIEKMINTIDDYNQQRPDCKPIIVSLEAEKPRNVNPELLQRGDFVFISKEYAKSLGFSTAEECLKGVVEKQLIKNGAKAICAWGEKGAWGLDESGSIVHSPAFPPIRVIDTLGAGDTFNAGVLHALSKGRTIEQALRLGCQVAGQKVGRTAFKIDPTLLDLL